MLVTLKWPSGSSPNVNGMTPSYASSSSRQRTIMCGITESVVDASCGPTGPYFIQEHGRGHLCPIDTVPHTVGGISIRSGIRRPPENRPGRSWNGCTVGGRIFVPPDVHHRTRTGGTWVGHRYRVRSTTMSTGGAVQVKGHRLSRGPSLPTLVDQEVGKHSAPVVEKPTENRSIVTRDYRRGCAQDLSHHHVVHLGVTDRVQPAL